MPGEQGQVSNENAVDPSATDRNREDYVSTGSLAGSIASTSSGFGSLPKKRPALFTSGKFLVFLTVQRDIHESKVICKREER